MARPRTRPPEHIPSLLNPPPASPEVSGFLPFEAELRLQGYAVVAGADEAGRGCLAGPVVAAAVVLPPDLHLEGVNDSKQLDEATRERLAPLIRAQALAWAVAEASAAEIDALNILAASLLAMQRALERLVLKPDFVLIDGNQKIPGLRAQRPIIKGDSLCFSIAAASILAKVERDRLMTELAQLHPGYGLALHKGYPTPTHKAALIELGPSPIHRLTFRGVPGWESHKAARQAPEPQPLLFADLPVRARVR